MWHAEQQLSETRSHRPGARCSSSLNVASCQHTHTRYAVSVRALFVGGRSEGSLTLIADELHFFTMPLKQNQRQQPSPLHPSRPPCNLQRKQHAKSKSGRRSQKPTLRVRKSHQPTCSPRSRCSEFPENFSPMSNMKLADGVEYLQPEPMATWEKIQQKLQPKQQAE